MIPSAVESWLVEALIADRVGDLQAAERAGLIVATPQQVSFRHELTRRAIADSLPMAYQVALNGRVLAALTAHADVDPSRLVHHAIAAGDAAAVVRHGVAAARDAVRTRAHREAVAHYRAVLAHRDRLPAGELAAVLEGYAAECLIVADVATATTALIEAVELRRGGSDRKALGEALRRLSATQAWDEPGPLPEPVIREAIDVLTETGDNRLLPPAYSHLAFLHLRASQYPEALRYGQRAVELARTLDEPAMLSQALNHLGSAQWLGEPAVGQQTLEESLRVALAAGPPYDASRAHMNLALELIEDLRLAEAKTHIEQVIELAEATEQFVQRGFAQPYQALLAFYTGEWDAADRVAKTDEELRPPIADRLMSVVRARVAVRRGHLEADALLALISAQAPSRDVQRVGLLAAGQAEAAWLRADLDAVRRHAEPAYEWACRLGNRRWQQDLGHWLVRAGVRLGDCTFLGPYELQHQGLYAEAAARWQAAGMPYEQADALAQSEDPDDLLAALSILDRLGAQPLARMVRERLRRQGVRPPRGSVTKMSDNTAGLTDRQIEVARLLARGWSNAQMAASLKLSVRTIDNHVAAVLAKLQVRRRREVLNRLDQMGVPDLPPARRRGDAESPPRF